MAGADIFERLTGRNEEDGGGWALVREWIESQQTEGVHLDFKTGPKPASKPATPENNAVIAKALSAFANTEGGLLVLGVVAKGRGKDQPDVASAIDAVPDVVAFRDDGGR